MNHIEKIHIEGFKKFRSMDIPLNSHMNILVGENEAGKSTILEALQVVLNQKYRTSDKSVLADLFNSEEVNSFKKNPSIQTLPKIVIEIQLNLSPDQKESSYFYGEVYGDKRPKKEQFGVRFECKFDNELGSGLEDFISEGNLPLDYYSLTWTTFANNSYRTVKRPFGFLLIDTTAHPMASSFNYYNKSLFNNRYDIEMQTRAKNEFRVKIDDAFESINLEPIDEKRQFGIDGKKLQLESVISVFEDSVPLENRGSGMESLIKTQIAFNKANGLDVVAMEEPENHLCFNNMGKMLHEIFDHREDSQVIITTHSSMIACSLNLKNVLWIAEDHVKSLEDVSDVVAKFFEKADNNAFLQLLLSKKALLVEGVTEFMMLPRIYYQITGRSIEADEITVISCGGISYARYLEIAEAADKKVSVITDNDGKMEKIKDSYEYNETHNRQHVFMDKDTKGWTWEACFYRDNKDTLEQFIKPKPGAKYLFHDVDYGPCLGKMLNNKADTAYDMVMFEENFNIPRYIIEAITWLNE